MEPSHGLLRSQVEDYFGDDPSFPPKWRTFIAEVDSTYREFDLTRERLEHKVAELSAATEHLQRQPEAGKPDLLSALMDNLPDLIYFKDTALRFICINEAHARFLGIKALDQAVGKTDFDFQPADVAQEFYAREQQIVKTGEPIVDRLEYYPTRAGQPRWFLTTQVPMFDSQGQVVGVAGIFRDITALKLAEAEAKLNEALERRVSERTAQLEAVNEDLRNEITQRQRAETVLRQTEKELRQLAEQRQRLLEVTRSFLSTFELEQIIRQLLHALGEVLKYSFGKFYWLDEAAGLLRPTVTMGQGWVELQQQTMTVGEGIIGQNVKLGRAELVNNAQLDPRSVYPPGVKIECEHLISISVRIKGEIIGAFTVMRENDPTFTEAEFELVQLFMSYAAIAIENAQLFEASRRQLQTLSALYLGAQKLSTTLDVRQLAQDVARTCVESFGVGLAWLGRAEPDGRIQSVSAYGQASELLASLMFCWDETPQGRGAVGSAIRTGAPVVIADPTADLWSATALSQEFRSIAAFPLMSRDQPFGVLALYSNQPDFFTQERVDFFKTFSYQAAAALENARLFAEAGQRAQEFEALYQITRDLALQRDLPTLLETIVEQAEALLGVGAGSVFLYDPVRKDLELAISHIPPVQRGTRFRLGEGIAGRVAQTRQPMIVENYSTWEHRSAQYENAILGATLEVPMLYRGELIGVLALGEIGARAAEAVPRKFTEADVRLLALFAGQAAAAVHNTTLLNETQRRLRQVQALHTIDVAIAASHELGLTLNLFFDQVMTQLGADAADVLLRNASTNTLDYVAGRGFNTTALQHTRLQWGEGHAGQAARARRIITIPDLRLRKSDFLRSPTFLAEGFITYYGVPLVAKEQVRGVLEIFHRTLFDPGPDWLEFLEAVAGQAAIAIDNATLFEDLQRSNLQLELAYDTTIEGWSRALDLRDRETEGHSRRVAEVTLDIARFMGIRGPELDHIRRGALLHDIGKMAVPDDILLKPGPLTEEEWVIMRKHPTYAYELLLPIDYLRPALDIPYCHHEKWDGTGYPRGLQGEQIPFAARIFAVVDVWDALRSDRPYRSAWPTDKVREHIRALADTHFDPRVTEVFLQRVTAPSLIRPYRL